MLNINKSIIPLLGYAIILNEEMHSRQIKLLEKVIKDNNYEEYREDIYNVINDKEEKVYKLKKQCINERKRDKICYLNKKRLHFILQLLSKKKQLIDQIFNLLDISKFKEREDL